MSEIYETWRQLMSLKQHRTQNRNPLGLFGFCGLIGLIDLFGLFGLFVLFVLFVLFGLFIDMSIRYYL